MATEPDPYRTLGLPPTASLAEVKAAYRRLAKVNHPDAAGAVALPRFLAIQAAYERLVGPSPGRTRPTPSPAPAPRRAWEADPDRSDATRRAYGGRARRPAGSTGTSSGKTSGRANAKSKGSGDSGSGSATAKDPKKATLGSTSYDEADREAFEPDWVGASWYGTTSGTYWTINPKEYADPRKHGPEYQARARRASQAAMDSETGSVNGGEAQTAGAEPEPPPISSTGPTDFGAPDPTPRHTTSSWWDATSGPATPGRDQPGSTAARPTPRPRPVPSRPLHATSTTSGPAAGNGLSGIGRALTQGTPPSVGWRIARAAIGWLPIALAIGWATGEVSGCARFSASCDSGIEPLVWIVQALVLIALVTLPVVAGWAVIAAMVSLAVAVPATLFVTAGAGSEASEAPMAGTAFLGVVLTLAWVVGIVGAVVMERRRRLDPAGPVS